jgi:hypothetical protein
VERVGARQRTVQRKKEVVAAICGLQRDTDRTLEKAAVRRDGWGRQRGRARQAVDPVGQHGHGAGIHEVPSQRRHLDRGIRAGGTLKQNRTPNVFGHHDAGVVVAQIALGKDSIDDALAGERGVIARVEGRTGTSRAMALSAIGIQVGTGTFLERCRQVGQRRLFCVTGNGRFIDAGIEQAGAVERAKLVVRNAGGGISESAVELPGLHAQHVA